MNASEKKAKKKKKNFFHEIAIVWHFPTIAVMEKVFMFSSQDISIIGWEKTLHPEIVSTG